MDEWYWKSLVKRNTSIVHKTEDQDNFAFVYFRRSIRLALASPVPIIAQRTPRRFLSTLRAQCQGRIWAPNAVARHSRLRGRSGRAGHHDQLCRTVSMMYYVYSLILMAQKPRLLVLISRSLYQPSFGVASLSRSIKVKTWVLESSKVSE